MTSTPTPTDPTEAHLRRALDAAAPADTQVDAGLADLRLRVDRGAAPAPIGLDERRHRRTATRWLAIAAAIVLVLGVAAVALRSGDRGSHVIAENPPRSATGWYIPKGLSGDWKLRSVQVDPMDTGGVVPTCPCLVRLWIDDASRSSIGLDQFVPTSSGLTDLLPTVAAGHRIAEVDLGGGITGTGGTHVPPPDDDSFVVWQHDGRASVVTGNGLTADQLITAARAVVGSRHSDEAPLPGYHLVERQDVPNALRTFHVLHLTLKNARTGALVTYALSPPYFDPVGMRKVPTVVNLPGTPGPLLRVEDGSNAHPSSAYLGAWTGGSVYTGHDADLGGPRSTGTDADVRTVLGSMRPATAAEWATFLDTATEPVPDKRTLAAPSLMDLAVIEPGQTTDVTRPTDPTTTNTASTTTITIAGGDPGPLTAADLVLKPVIAVYRCDSPARPSGELVADPAGQYCYELGATVADGRDLDRAEAALQEDWVMNVHARSGAKHKLNGLFNACYEAARSCPSQSASGRGAVAIVLSGKVISAPAVNGPNLANDAFTVSGAPAMTKAAAQDLADAINAG